MISSVTIKNSKNIELLIFFCKVWEHYDQEIQMTPMPTEFKDFKAEVLCKDCQKVHFRIKYLIFHLGNDVENAQEFTNIKVV